MIELKRKNGRKDTPGSKYCKGVEQGVDLNRNYDVSWVEDISKWFGDGKVCG